MSPLRSYLLVACVAVCAASTLSAAERANDSAVGPRITEAEFYSALDLERPDLAAVRAAVEKSDWAAARRAFAEHLRMRQTPRWTFDPRAIGQDPKRHVAGADKALEHRFNSIGIEWKFGDQIDWAFNPTTQPDSKWPSNHEWTWQFSRHAMWTELGRAFYATGDEKYAREFVAELKSWVRNCPVPLRVDNGAFSRWRTIEAGIRMGTVWPEVYHLFLTSKSFDDEALTLMVKSEVEHARYLTKNFTKGNWLTMESNGLYHVGALFPEFKEAKTWRETGLGRLYKELSVQVYPDGAQIELAPGYHGVAVHNFLGPVNLVALTGFEVPKDYTATMEKMFDYFLYSMQPTRRTPALNDSAAGDIVRWMETGANLFPHRQDFRWVATGGKQGQAPAMTSYRFPYAGQFIFRSGWDRQALWLCMDGGPFGFGHQHEDKLGITLTAFGKSLLVEGGVYTYDASEWRKYVLSSRAHNVVLVDGLEQARRKEPRETYVVTNPLPQIWETSPEFDHAAARYDEGWGSGAKRVVKQTRHVFFVKPGLFVVADEFEPADSQPHTYEALFHLDAEDAGVNGLEVKTGGTGPALTIAAFGADGVSIVKGQKSPVVQGWLPDSSEGYGGIRPIPTAVFRRHASGRVTMLYALVPSATPSACPVKALEVSGGVLTVTFTDGTTKTLRFQQEF